MKNLSNPLLSYSITLIVLITLALFVFNPSLRNITLGLLLLPLFLTLFALWKKIEATPTATTQLLFLIAGLAIALFIFQTLQFFSQPSAQELLNQQRALASDVAKLGKTIASLEKAPKSDTFSDELGQVKAQLGEVQSELFHRDETLGSFDISTATNPAQLSVTPTPATASYITLADPKWKSIDVYEDKFASSKIIGEIIYGKTYKVLKKEGDYFQITLSSALKGWLHKQFVKEIL